MSYHNTVFPEAISRGSLGGPGFRTIIDEQDSGQENRVGLWSAPRYQFNVAKGLQSQANLYEVRQFYIGRSGALHTFPFKDWSEFTSNPTDPSYRSAAGTQDQSTYPTQGDGSETVFRLAKTYTSGSQVVTKFITKPKSGTIQIWVNGVLQTEGVTYTLDYATGQATFSSPPTSGHEVEWSGEFYLECRFGAEADATLGASLDGYDFMSIASIPVIEVWDGSPGYIHEQFFGGSFEDVITVDIALSYQQAALYSIDADRSGLSLVLPDPTNYPPGGPIFTIHNKGATNSFTVVDQADNTLATLSTDDVVFASILKNTSSDTPTWFVIGA